MKLITVPAPVFPRKAYELEGDEEKKFIEFTIGDKVLPAEYFDDEKGMEFTFIKRHENGEKGWDGGGYECYDSTGARRNFYLDALIIHPDKFERKARAAKIMSEPNKPIGTGKRGRPAMDPSLKKVQEEYKPTGGTRGRKALDPEERERRIQERLNKAKEKQQKRVESGKSTGQRGRKPLSPEEKAKREEEAAAKRAISKGMRGRPKKILTE